MKFLFCARLCQKQLQHTCVRDIAVNIVHRRLTIFVLCIYICSAVYEKPRHFQVDDRDLRIGKNCEMQGRFAKEVVLCIYVCAKGYQEIGHFRTAIHCSIVERVKEPVKEIWIGAAIQQGL